ncbi:MAG: hypothetical protein QM715_00695 [Nibricoccus sp.]
MRTTSVFKRAGFYAPVILALSLFSGCATAPRIPLTTAGSQIAPSQVLLGIDTQEIGTSIDPSAAGAAAGGLIGAIVDLSIENSRAKKAEQAIIPVRNALIGYDATAALCAAVQKEIGSVDWLKSAQIQVTQTAGQNSAKVLLSKAPGDAVFVVNVEYYLTPKFDGIIVAARVELHARSAALIKKGEKREADGASLLYYNKLSVVSHLGTAASTDKEPNAKLWAEENGKKAKDALDTGLSEVAKMLVFDLTQPGTKDHALYEPPANTKPDRVVPISSRGGSSLAMIMVNGYIVHTDDIRVWVRTPSGELVSTLK